MTRIHSKFLNVGAASLIIGCTPPTDSSGREVAISAPTHQHVNQLTHYTWHKVQLSFEGPQTSESGELNPFTDILLKVVFKHESGKEWSIRGFYAADGNAADTSAAAGNIWQARFAPPLPGKWTWTAKMLKGHDAVLTGIGTQYKVQNSTGAFLAQETTAAGPDFRATGKIVTDEHIFRTVGNGAIWWKSGSNSPENFLGYTDFDDTYRLSVQHRDGESHTNESIHQYKPHASDYRSGDPTWANGKGKNIIGAINYLADQGMNAIYFVTLNIGGDGRDVWPYMTADHRDRFDVSKLDQWERVFTHMQTRGIALHVVLQETENELMLDDGDTGRERQLYLSELAARFAHHPGLIWNLGEENGPASWMKNPDGQDTEQRIAMSDYLRAVDAYNHPIFLHTHSNREDKDEILTAHLGGHEIDGLSFQVSAPSDVMEEIAKWRRLSANAGNPWVITMDEIGPWNIGTQTDEQNADHDLLRREVLWGTFLAGGAGVEWYFGYETGHHDLNSEDWRLRANMWRQTDIARSLIAAIASENPLAPCGPSDTGNALACAKTKDGRMVFYLVEANSFDTINNPNATLMWIDPRNGQRWQIKNNQTAEGIADAPIQDNRDWVLLINPHSVETDLRQTALAGC